MTGGQLDQLWFTWTTRGLEQGQGAQVRAASDQLADRRSRAAATARRYCYRPSGERSFGWIDHEGHRVVFNRVGGGVDSSGRSGTFFVHVILGDPIDLPARFLWTLHDSKFWVTKDSPESSVSLPTVSVEEIGLVPRLPEATDADVAFMAFFLHCVERRARMQVSMAESQLVRHASLLAKHLLPGLDLVSVSTSESVRSAPEYDIVCSDEPLPSFLRYDGVASAAGLTTYDAAVALLEPTEAIRTQVRAAADMNRSRRGFVSQLINLSALQTGRAVEPDTLIALASQSSDALRTVVTGPGRRVIAEAIQAGNRGALDLVDHLDSDGEGQLAGEVARLVSAHPGTVVRSVRMLVGKSKVFVREVIRRVVEHLDAKGTVSELSVADRLELLRLLHLSGGRMSKAVSVLAGEDEASVRAVGAESGLPGSWRATAVLGLPGYVTSGKFDGILLADDALALQVVAGLDGQDRAATIGRLAGKKPGREALDWLGRLAEFVDRDALDEAWWQALPRVTAEDRLAAVLARAMHSAVLDTESWEEPLTESLCEVVLLRADERGTPLFPELNTMRSCLSRLRPNSDGGQNWIEVLDGWNALTQGTNFINGTDRMLKSARRLPGRHGVAAAIAAAEAAVSTASNYNLLREVADKLIMSTELDELHSWPTLILAAGFRCQTGGPEGLACSYAVRLAMDYRYHHGLGWPDKDSVEYELMVSLGRRIPYYYRREMLESIDGWKWRQRRRAEKFLRTGL